MKIRFNLVLNILLTTIQVVWIISLYSQLVLIPYLGKVDFISYFTAGTVARESGYGEVYDLSKQKAVQMYLSGGEIWFDGEVLPFYHPPYFLPVLKYVISGDYTLSYMRWEFFLFIFLAISWGISAKSLKKAGYKSTAIIMLNTALFLFYPLWISLLVGQDTVILLCALILWFYAIKNNKDLLGGMALSLATIRPHIALVLAIPFLWRRQKVFVGFSIGMFALLFYSVFLVGVDGMVEFVQLILVSAAGESYGINQAAMVNLLGLLLRMFPDITASDLRFLIWGTYLASIIALCVVWYRSKSINLQMLGSSILVAVLIAPHLHYHDLAILFIPLLCLAFDHRTNPLVISLLSVFLILADPTPLRGYVSYGAIVIILLLLWIEGPIQKKGYSSTT